MVAVTEKKLRNSPFYLVVYTKSNQSINAIEVEFNQCNESLPHLPLLFQSLQLVLHTKYM